MVRNNFMMHLCTVATLCFLEKTFPKNYYYSDQDDNSLSLCFKSMYLTLFVAIFTSNFIFSMSKSFHTYRNINISNQSYHNYHCYHNHQSYHSNHCYHSHQNYQLFNFLSLMDIGGKKHKTFWGFQTFHIIMSPSNKNL